jgi:hypothetical protein
MVWEVLAGSVLSAGLGALGSNSAAKQQEQAANRAGELQRRGSLAQLQMNEPQRALGYQALGDIASLYGYSQAPYATIGQVQSTLSPISYKNVQKYLKQGASFEDIAAMGTLGTPGKKGIKRLIKGGLTMDQILQLQRGPQATAPAAGAPAAGTATQPAAGNMDRFFTSPDYQFRQEQGAQAIDRSAAARSGALSGNAIRAGTEYASNLASGEFGNYMNRLFQVAGLGSAATNASQGAVQSGVNGQAQAAQAAGDARASGIMGGVNSAVGAINNGTSLYALQQYMKQPQSPAAPPTMSPYGPYAGGYQLPQTPPAPWRV